MGLHHRSVHRRTSRSLNLALPRIFQELSDGLLEFRPGNMSRQHSMDSHSLQQLRPSRLICQQQHTRRLTNSPPTLQEQR
jgi:hypothetical protein